jgi:hypothetical protein
MHPVAFYDALNCASLAVLAAEGGDCGKAETALLEASVAASEAFPVGSAGFKALGVILDAVSAIVGGSAVAA